MNFKIFDTGINEYLIFRPKINRMSDSEPLYSPPPLNGLSKVLAWMTNNASDRYSLTRHGEIFS